MANDSHDKPLSNLKVIDFSAVFAGPICTRLLADCGAEVIKVEPPGGDVIRGPTGISRVFAHFNAGKKCIAIDMANAEGQALIRELLQDADVVVENYRPGIMGKFGLDYESLKSDFPQLVYCSISGFGQRGPFAQRAAYAPIAHAASGFDLAHAAVQPEPHHPPVWSIMIADMLTGAYAHGAILTALLGRARHGRGEYIDVTMMESMMLMIPGQVQAAQYDEPPPAFGFQPIRCNDGFITIAIVSPKNMQCLCDAIGKPALMEDERFMPGNRVLHMDEFVAEVEAWTLQRSAEEAERLMGEAHVPCSGYNAPGDLFNHPQLIARGTFTEFEDETSKFLVQNAPFKLAGCDISTTPTMPALGEHTLEILGALRDKRQLRELAAQGAILQGKA